MNLILRKGRPEDLDICSKICYEAFNKITSQHNFPPYFPSLEATTSLLSPLFKHPNIYSVVAEVDGRVVGSIFLSQSNSIAGVGPLSVDPTVQNAGIGKRLMSNVLERVNQLHFAGVRLVQTAYHTRSLSLYTKLGFNVREPLVYLQGSALKLEIPGYAVRSCIKEDLDACNQLCFKIHGHNRSGELLDAIQQGTATVVERNGNITGYTTMIGFHGHAIGETNSDLKALIGAASTLCEPGFIIPTRNTELFRWCLSVGLRVVEPMTLMSIGLYNEPMGPFLPSVIY